MSEAFIAALPKAALHVHLECTLEPDEMLRLAAANGVPLPWRNEQEIRAACRAFGR